MSSENDDPLLPVLPVETKQESQEVPKFSYTRDFLLSLSELDICKKLPVGFDASILSEFEDPISSTVERQRNLGGLSLQSSKRSDYGSTLPNRLEGPSSYSRGSHGRWDTHSSGSSDKDGEAQSDRESFTQDSGRRHVNQSRRSWQNPEHDGLLGSGAFPRPPGSAGGFSATKARGNDHYQLTRSAEPYQPPRPYKAVPYSRKDSDACNDETFGSSDCSSLDRAEEERKRRDSFELMRKEQQKSLQEKHKQIPEKRKENLGTDISALSENSEDDRVVRDKNNNKSDDTLGPMVSQNDTLRYSFHMQAPASRPLVPPGFASTLAEKNLYVHSSNTSLASEAGNDEMNGNPLFTRGTPAANGTDNKQNYESMNASVSLVDVSETIRAPKSGLEVVDSSVHFSNMTYESSGLLEAGGHLKDGVVIDSDSTNVASSEVTDTGSQDDSTSILEKLFGNALTKTGAGSPNFVQHQGVKADEETWGLSPSQSSKFAHWFLEEEKKPVEDLSSRDLLSLIVNNDNKGGSQVTAVSDEQVIEQIPLIFPFENIETTQKHLTSSATSIAGNPEPYYPSNKIDTSAGVLTCESFEQSMFAEVNESSSSLQDSVQGPLNGNEKSDLQKADVDDRASQHLLSLLQKGTSSRDVTLSPNLDNIGTVEKLGVSDVRSSIAASAADNASAGNAETVHNSDRTLTLEALFGTAFMKELQSVEAPVSVHRGSVGGCLSTNVSQPQGVAPSHAIDGFFSSMARDNGSKITHGRNMSSLDLTQETKAHKVHEPWLGFEDSQTEGSKTDDAVGFEGGPAELHLPEEDSLITVNDAVNPIISELLPVGNASKTEQLITSKAPNEIVDKLAALNAILINQRASVVPGLDGLPPLRGPYDLVDSELTYQHLHGRPSSPQFLHHQMNHSRPLLQQLDHHAHRNPQMNFIGPESIHHDPHHPFPANVIHHHPFHGPGGPQFDPPAHLPMLQHMPMPRNFPPQHPLQGFPRGVSPSHPINHMPTYMPEINPIQGFPMNYQQPNYGGVGMRPPGSGVGGDGRSYPEALERLIQMELRAKSNQAHPVAAGHIAGIYDGPELDRGYRYR